MVYPVFGNRVAGIMRNFRVYKNAKELLPNRCGPIARGDVPMEGEQPRLGKDRLMKRGDITVAQKNFGVSAYEAIIQLVEQARRTRSAPQANDHAHVRVGKHTMYIRHPIFIPTRQVAISVHGMLAELGAKAHAFKTVLDPIHHRRIRQRGRWAHKSYHIAQPDPWRRDQGVLRAPRATKP